MDEKLEQNESLEQTQTPPETEPESSASQSPYNNPSSFTPPNSPRKRSPKKLLYLVAFIALLLVLVSAVRFVAGKFKKTPAPTPVAVATPEPTLEPTPETSPTPSASPTATPKAAVNSIDSSTGLDRAKLSIAVQNGSGEAGAGGKAADFLKGLGYNVTSTGNADNFNYTGTTIQVKSASSSFLSLLKKDLGASYTVTSATSDLTASSSADALVIVGK